MALPHIYYPLKRKNKSGVLPPGYIYLAIRQTNEYLATRDNTELVVRG
jgi:hypothetical protein